LHVPVNGRERCQEIKKNGQMFNTKGGRNNGLRGVKKIRNHCDDTRKVCKKVNTKADPLDRKTKKTR